jgi:phosphate transport system permease protein
MAHWQTTLVVCAANGIAMRILIIARIAGETALGLFTAFGTGFVSTRLAQPIASLIVQVYTYAVSVFVDWVRRAWAGARVLAAIVLVLESRVRSITRGSVGVAR